MAGSSLQIRPRALPFLCFGLEEWQAGALRRAVHLVHLGERGREVGRLATFQGDIITLHQAYIVSLLQGYIVTLFPRALPYLGLPLWLLSLFACPLHLLECPKSSLHFIVGAGAKHWLPRDKAGPFRRRMHREFTVFGAGD